ncbi:MAG: radical SAM protein [Lachnospiraceae bacterium]|nr:radical SAM protein [Lachnospiraceae bacterium]
MINGIVADIQRASVHDGPGIRTTVFLKGCPLHCAWCHNPECIDFRPQVMYYPEKCIGCGLCDKGCFSGARVICGKEMSVQDVLKEVLLDRDYYGTEGGITISGGEPLAQRQFVNALIDACKKENIRCAMETSLIFYDEETFKKLDLVMADLKIWDNELHKKYTGVENVKIKEHFRRLNGLGIPIIARTPVISEIDQQIAQISKFLSELENVKKYELLPYHPLGESKREALGMTAENFTIPSAEYMKELEKYVFVR